jgi:hypothetical protein
MVKNIVRTIATRILRKGKWRPIPSRKRQHATSCRAAERAVLRSRLLFPFSRKTNLGAFEPKVAQPAGFYEWSITMAPCRIGMAEWI